MTQKKLIALANKVKKIDRVERLLKTYNIDNLDYLGLAFFLGFHIENDEIRKLSSALRKILTSAPETDLLEDWEANKPIINDKDKTKNLLRIISSILNTILLLESKGCLKISLYEEISSYFSTNNSKLYHGFQHKISIGDFDLNDTWPVANLSGRNLQSRAIIKPDPEQPLIDISTKQALQAKMRNKVLDLAKRGDLTADIFDVITAKWIHETDHHEAMITISADEILRARKIKDKDGGYTGRYTHEQRKEIQQQIDNLSYTWITVEEMEVIEEVNGKRKKTKWRGESKAIALTSRFGQIKFDGTTDAFAWRVRPGDVFAKFLHGPGRQTALLSNKALHYDYYRHKMEKRITRYLAWLWRIDQNRSKEGVFVKTFLEAVGIPDKPNRPGDTRDRFEEALDRLSKDKVISAWEYENADEDIFLNKKNWWKNWVEWKVIITAPPEVLEHYKMLDK